MYRVSPFTYFTDALLSVGLANTDVVCAANEYLVFSPPSGQTCGAYMSTWISEAGGYILDPNATDTCNFCAIQSTNTFLSAVSSSYSRRWRNFGIIWVYIGVNAVAAVGLYWLARVPKNGGKREKKQKKQSEKEMKAVTGPVEQSGSDEKI